MGVGAGEGEGMGGGGWGREWYQPPEKELKTKNRMSISGDVGKNALNTQDQLRMHLYMHVVVLSYRR